MPRGWRCLRIVLTEPISFGTAICTWIGEWAISIRRHDFSGLFGVTVFAASTLVAVTLVTVTMRCPERPTVAGSLMCAATFPKPPRWRPLTTFGAVSQIMYILKK
ncbi:hypothetical protein KM472_gp255 [Cynomolgus macaque cytomegalovirus strain Ottawa]|uniref:Uncharacterized protein n=1 Tax=macacine betaherpesvirus 8 TaxID=2560567 RepID=G8H0Y4_9BETA|nr:hypothetical protein KM472_gp255 [Cynomolgus macaque cytomegalovirus strain Ottawa]AEQ32332.1 hypothetical protein cy243 [Cynomolgus macaque cytomegalovirus strain Ottawa]